MIKGSGLLAQAFAPEFSGREDVCIYAAGVSNSNCIDIQEFAREHFRLTESLKQAINVDVFVYFGTCSVDDLEAQKTPYVLHKLAMEKLVALHPRHFIFRLPQVAGHTPNPHTLLNFLYARISRSESFQLWSKASRNIIDVVDIAAIASQCISSDDLSNKIINIANPVCYSMMDIVAAMEKAVGKRAIYNTVDRGSGYSIDISLMLPLLNASAVEFGSNYLDRVFGKYYGKSN